MQLPPLIVSDVNLLLIIGSLVLLLTLELISPHYGSINIIVNKKKLKNVTLATVIISLISFVFSVINLLFTT
jgi:hypothetical protein